MSNVAVFVGLDDRQESVQVCVLDREGRRLLNRVCPNDWRKIAEAVEPVGKVERAAVEACCGAADLSQELRSRARWPLDLAHEGDARIEEWDRHGVGPKAKSRLTGDGPS